MAIKAISANRGAVFQKALEIARKKSVRALRTSSAEKRSRGSGGELPFCEIQKAERTPYFKSSAVTWS